jgi:hypothetical protein
MTEPRTTDAQQDLLTTLTGVREELSQVRQAALDLQNPEFVRELGLSMLEILAKQLQAVIALARNTTPPAPPVGSAEVVHGGRAIHGSALPPESFPDKTVTSIPAPALVVNPDGMIVAANIPAEQLFGKPLKDTHLEDLVPEARRTQHAYWRQGFAAGFGDVGHHQAEVRIMGHGRTVPGLRADGVEMDLDVALGPYPGKPGFTLALMTPKLRG